MKKLIVSIAFVFATLSLQAQSYTRDSLFFEVNHPTGSPYFAIKQPRSFMTSDGKVFTWIPTVTLVNYKIIDFGDWLYKIDPQNLTVLDSAFVETDYTMQEDNITPLLANDPDGDGYILAKLIHNKLSYPGFPGKTWLRISRIDGDLNMQPHEDAVKVVLEDSTIINNLIGITLEGDKIVLAYNRESRTPVVARIGLDGTIYDRTAFEDLFLLGYVKRGLAVYNDTPREYCLSDWTACEDEKCLVYHVFDSLFTLKETIIMEGHTGDVYTAHQGQYAPKPMPLEDGSFVYSFKYKRNNIIRNGAALKKIDKTTNECLACAQFESWPIYTDPDLMGYPIGLVKTVNDNLYFAYRTNNNISGGAAISKGWLGIAKLDKDLNIIWQRYCLGSYSAATGYFHKYCHVSQIEDGFAIVGYIQRGEDPWRLFYYFIHDGDPDGFPDTESFLRPYMFFPNPAQDQLTMQYSPDVQPRQIELYDLQGRLVRAQKQGLESLNLQGLVPGQYLMKVTMTDGKVYTDRMVKE